MVSNQLVSVTRLQSLSLVNPPQPPSAPPLHSLNLSNHQRRMTRFPPHHWEHKSHFTILQSHPPQWLSHHPVMMVLRREAKIFFDYCTPAHTVHYCPHLKTLFLYQTMTDAPTAVSLQVPCPFSDPKADWSTSYLWQQTCLTSNIQSWWRQDRHNVILQQLQIPIFSLGTINMDSAKPKR